MLLDFGWLREQVCMVACPYGRLQSVLLDRRSLIVGYDARRGEPRGKLGQRGLAPAPRPRPRETASTAAPASSPVPPASTSATGSRWSASTARSASTRAIRSWTGSAARAASSATARATSWRARRGASCGRGSSSTRCCSSSSGAASSARSPIARRADVTVLRGLGSPFTRPALGRRLEPDPHQDRQPRLGGSPLPDRRRAGGRRAEPAARDDLAGESHSRGGRQVRHGHGLRRGAGERLPRRARGRALPHRGRRGLERRGAVSPARPRGPRGDHDERKRHGDEKERHER